MRLISAAAPVGLTDNLPWHAWLPLIYCMYSEYKVGKRARRARGQTAQNFSHRRQHCCHKQFSNSPGAGTPVWLSEPCLHLRDLWYARGP